MVFGLLHCNIVAVDEFEKHVWQIQLMGTKPKKTRVFSAFETRRTWLENEKYVTPFYHQNFGLDYKDSIMIEEPQAWPNLSIWLKEIAATKKKLYFWKFQIYLELTLQENTPNSDGGSGGHQCRRTFVTDCRPISDENQKFEVVGILSTISDGIPTKHGSSEFSDDFSTTFR